MIIYLKAYSYRWKIIAIAICVACLPFVLCAFLWNNRVETVDDQIDSYRSSEYEMVYWLNYDIGIDNSFVYADADVAVFNDNDNKRLPVTVLMRNPTVDYSLSELSFANDIECGSIVISKNVAEQQGLKKGDTLFLEFSYSQARIPVTVSLVETTNYDFSNPNIDNNIGVVYIGIDEDYINSTLCKYIVFSESSISSMLGDYPQIISDVSYKSQMEQTVIGRNLYILLIECIASIASCCLAFRLISMESNRVLKRCYLKGLGKRYLIITPIIEEIIIFVIPALALWASYTIIKHPHRWYSVTFGLIPVIAAFFFIVVYIFVNNKRIRKAY